MQETAWRPDPAGIAYSAPLDPLADGEGAGCPHPKNPIPALSLSGIARPPLPNFQPPRTKILAKALMGYVGRVRKVQRAPSAGPRVPGQKFLKTFSRYSEMKTSGYQTLKCFIATLPA